VISSRSSDLLNFVSKIISQDRFRTYFNNDVIGTQIGGAMKNVIAIASGFILGNGLGNNANASIITRGLSEMIELGLKMGAKKNTFYGLSGIGDLTLTCSSLKSRNTKLGYLLAKKKKKTNAVVEGMDSCDSICNLGKKFDVELPICNSVKKILSGKSFNEITKMLLSRPLQFER
jgi:glycerol-3-phosphate dehydrogenase (NAD(P)+)